MGLPSVTVVVAVYQAEKTLERCLNSILNQSFTNWQAILIDDASADKSLEIMQKYAGEDFRFIIASNAKNSGVAYTRNRALEMVKSDYVTFLDADDWWDGDTLSVLLSAAQKYDADIVQCKYQYNYANGNGYIPGSIFPELTVIEKSRFCRIYWRMMTGMKMNHVCMKLMKADLLCGLFFEEGLRTGEDLEFCMKVLPKAKRFVYIPAPMYHYYRESGNLTGSSLSFREKWMANRYISSLMQKKLPQWGMKNVFFTAVVWLRPYLLTVSKIFRTLKDRAYSKGVSEVDAIAQK